MNPCSLLLSDLLYAIFRQSCQHSDPTYPFAPIFDRTNQTSQRTSLPLGGGGRKTSEIWIGPRCRPAIASIGRLGPVEEMFSASTGINGLQIGSYPSTDRPFMDAIKCYRALTWIRTHTVSNLHNGFLYSPCLYLHDVALLNRREK